MEKDFKELLTATGLIGIFRGVKPDEAVSIVGAAIDSGLRIVEVPLNSPNPLDSIQQLAKSFSGQALVGAGTVTCTAEVDAVAEAGGQLIVTPYARPDVVQRAKALGLVAVPGALTPTEIANMHDCGADAVKIFPADLMPPAVLKGLLAVLPQEISLIPVGGIDLDNMKDYVAAGVHGFGLGSSLYRMNDSATDVSRKTAAFVAKLKALRGI